MIEITSVVHTRKGWEWIGGVRGEEGEWVFVLTAPLDLQSLPEMGAIKHIGQDVFKELPNHYKIKIDRLGRRLVEDLESRLAFYVQIVA